MAVCNSRVSGSSESIDKLVISPFAGEVAFAGEVEKLSRASQREAADPYSFHYVPRTVSDRAYLAHALYTAEKDKLIVPGDDVRTALNHALFKVLKEQSLATSVEGQHLLWASVATLRYEMDYTCGVMVTLDHLWGVAHRGGYRIMVYRGNNLVRPIEPFYFEKSQPRNGHMLSSLVN